MQARSSSPICPACALPFPPSRPWQTYCSDDCRRKHFWKTRVTMKLLPEVFTEGKFIFTQLDRNCDFAVYKKQPRHTRTHSFEVVRIRHRPAETIYNKDYPLREVYPGNEQWGTDGWTFTTEADARKQFSLLSPTSVEQTSHDLGTSRVDNSPQTQNTKQ